MKRNMKGMTLKGMTLVEMVVVIAVIAVMSAILVPSVLGYLEKARVTAAIADARTIKQTVENSLLDRFSIPKAGDNPAAAVNKRIWLDGTSYKQYEKMGGFTNVSWKKYRDKKTVDQQKEPSQYVDKVIAAGLDHAFGNESWRTGTKEKNPLLYCTEDQNCSDYLDAIGSNFGLVVVYSSSYDVRMLQVYRRGILVTYVNGEYIANTSKNAHFVGKSAWSTIYTDVGKTAPEGMNKLSLSDKQFLNNKWTGWYP